MILKIKMILKKTIKMLIKKIIKYPKIKNPKLYMTLLIKNEEDIIEENLIFHKKMGVDGFIVTDNNSTDNTNKILEKYYKKGWIKEIILEKSQEYSQVEWVDKMIKIAKNKYNADWIINADADEFWVSKNKNLKINLSNSDSNIIKCNIYNVFPENTEFFFKNTKVIRKSVDNDKLSRFSLYTEQIPKVLHRSKGYKKITMGNHGVKMNLPKEEISNDIEILHYSIRGLKHFKEKMINGGKSVEKNLKLGKNVANHWRYFYEGYKNKTFDFDEEYLKVIGEEHLQQFEKRNIFCKNESVKKIIEKEFLKEK